MATIRVIGLEKIDNLTSDMADIPVRAAVKFPQVVEWNTQRGLKIAQRFAKERSGLHGKNLFKRYTADVKGLRGEYGPHSGGTPVGGGFRHGPSNMDMPNSADLIGPDFASDVLDAADGLFW